MADAGAARIQMSHFPPNPGVLPGGGWKFTSGTTFGDPTPPRMWVDGVYGGVRNIVATDAITLAGRAGPLTVQAAQALTVAEAAGVVVRCVANPLCIAGAGVAAVVIKDLVNDYRIRPSGGSGFGLEQDVGQAPTLQEAWGLNYQGAQVFTSATAASSAWRDGLFAGKTVRNVVVDEKWLAPGPDTYLNSCVTYQYSLDGGNNWSNSNSCGNFVKKPNALFCPAVVDFSDPRYSVPGGPIGKDGKCPTGRYSGTTTDDAVSKVVAFPPGASDARFKNAVSGAVDKGGESSPAELTVSGPASQTGTPVTSTTTGPNGTVTETKTPTITYNYGGDTITYNESMITVVNNNGSTTTTTTPTESAKPQDAKDPCTANPGRVGCMELGSPPDDKVPKKQQTLTYSQESLGLPASCPPDVLVQSHGQTIRMSYQGACNAANDAKPWIRAGGALVALFIVLAALREL